MNKKEYKLKNNMLINYCADMMRSVVHKTTSSLVTVDILKPLVEKSQSHHTNFEKENINTGTLFHCNSAFCNKSTSNSFNPIVSKFNSFSY